VQLARLRHLRAHATFVIMKLYVPSEVKTGSHMISFVIGQKKLGSAWFSPTFKAMAATLRSPELIENVGAVPESERKMSVGRCEESDRVKTEETSEDAIIIDRAIMGAREVCVCVCVKRARCV
jgi:hypothetical protein